MVLSHLRLGCVDAFAYHAANFGVYEFLKVDRPVESFRRPLFYSITDSPYKRK
jgi:hypothetical protein